MDTDIHRSTRKKATITLSSDCEPVETDGTFDVLDDGFILEFGIGGDKYAITHTAEKTVFECDGAQKYSFVLCGGIYRSKLETPFGELGFSVVDGSRNATVTDDGVNLDLSYTLAIDGAADDVRKVGIAARFINLE